MSQPRFRKRRADFYAALDDIREQQGLGPYQPGPHGTGPDGRARREWGFRQDWRWLQEHGATRRGRGGRPEAEAEALRQELEWARDHHP